MTKDDLEKAVRHLEAGDWEAAHKIVQADEDSQLACWAHAIVHLMEGDESNARYWFGRAGRSSISSIDAEIAALKSAANAGRPKR